jgi:hypothetical protein
MATDLLILSIPHDLHAIAVAREIEKRGKTCTIIDAEWSDDCPLYYKIGMHAAADKAVELRSITIDTATTLWRRRPFTPTSNENVSDSDKDFVRAEKRMGLHGMF